MATRDMILATAWSTGKGTGSFERLDEIVG